MSQPPSASALTLSEGSPWVMELLHSSIQPASPALSLEALLPLRPAQKS